MKLHVFMQENGLDDAAMAARVQTSKIRCDRSMISRYRRRIGRPDWPVIARIKQVTRQQVTADDFLELAGDR